MNFITIATGQLSPLNFEKHVELLGTTTNYNHFALPDKAALQNVAPDFHDKAALQNVAPDQKFQISSTHRLKSNQITRVKPTSIQKWNILR